MDGRTSYLNTDLDLVSARDLTSLAAALEEKKWFVLHVEQGADGLWSGAFETWQVTHSSPKQTIATMVKVVERLPAPLREIWDDCSKRDFNMGFDGGVKPRHFEQTLPAELVARIAALGASLTVTIYACDQEVRPTDAPSG